MAKKSDKNITIKPEKMSETLNLIYQFGAEHVLKGFASGQLSVTNAQEIYSYSQAGKANWPTIKLCESGNDIIMNISIEGSILHQELIDSEKKSTTSPNHKTPKIRDIREHLDTHVIGQAVAKRAVARAGKLHYERCFGEPTHNNTKLNKQNVLIHGPSGCGKTEIARALATFLGISVFIEDTSQLSPSGYKGRNIEDMAREIWLQCDKNMEKAQTSIVVLDEFDKMGAIGNGSGVAGFRQSVMNDLLKFVEGGVIPFKEYANAPETQFLDTSNILIIALGAFEGIEHFFAEQGSIGFGAEKIKTETPNRNDIVNDINLEHFNKWGFNSQILGRFPIRTHILELTVEELVEIQKNVPGSVYHQWVELFARLDNHVELEFTSPVFEAIAQKAIKQKTGARELVAEYSELLGEAYDTAEDDENIKSIKVCVKGGKPIIQYSTEINALEKIFKQTQIDKEA